MKILIVDDHSLFIQGISVLLTQSFSHIGLQIEAHEQVDTAFSTLSHDNNVDIVLSDIYMPTYKDKTLLELLIDNAIMTPVLLVSATDDKCLIKRFLDLGAAGFVHKSGKSGELKLAIEEVIATGSYLNPELQRELLALPETVHKSLSARQKEVLSYMADGLSNKEIGARMGVTESTIKTHVSALFDVFRASNRMECMLNAKKMGII
ncbi:MULTISPECIES: response regulator transcription factor [unclassified Hahella]|uniref:response regulator transcription factor n=1 Tax=unclassified Hahella TaxID=2624107 RepID=UPI001C1ED941|nr:MULTISPECIES: response regulator transcription factor [unclassified Hahella]MBU6952734.1 response regulator transcription factor [Hahella sp. HN01]MDG9667017.1 response regulator transcription factor [Hahella sp. CR1]